MSSEFSNPRQVEAHVEDKGLIAKEEKFTAIGLEANPLVDTTRRKLHDILQKMVRSEQRCT